jgi:hypothetical protein
MGGPGSGRKKGSGNSKKEKIIDISKIKGRGGYGPLGRKSMAKKYTKMIRERHGGSMND